jgi:hypothetical protein
MIESVKEKKVQKRYDEETIADHPYTGPALANKSPQSHPQDSSI